MPDAQPAARRVIALSLVGSSVALAVLAGLIYTGTVPISEEARGLASLGVGIAAVADFVIGLWFFRMGQST